MTLTKTTIEPERNTARAAAHTLDIVRGAVREVLTLNRPLSTAEVYHLLNAGGARPASVSHYKGVTTIVFKEE